MSFETWSADLDFSKQKVLDEGEVGARNNDRTWQEL